MKRAPLIMSLSSRIVFGGRVCASVSDHAIINTSPALMHITVQGTACSSRLNLIGGFKRNQDQQRERGAGLPMAVPIDLLEKDIVLWEDFSGLLLRG